MTKYVIATELEHSIAFYDKKYKDFTILTKITPRIFPNKKKAKRVLKKLNKNSTDNYYLLPVIPEYKQLWDYAKIRRRINII